jgi:hypothetical protein
VVSGRVIYSRCSVFQASKRQVRTASVASPTSAAESGATVPATESPRYAASPTATPLPERRSDAPRSSPQLNTETAAEAAKLTEDEQQAVVMRYVNNAIANLTSQRANGQAKSREKYEADRAMANLLRALFMPDSTHSNPRHPNGEPPVLNSMLKRINKAATASPNKKVPDVMGEFIDSLYARFYTDHYNPDQKLKFAANTDDDQVKMFRLQIELRKIDWLMTG